MKNFELSIIWWNTSLSPPISSNRKEASIEKKQIIASVIQKFMVSNYEFICLGEVSSEDLLFFEKTIEPQKFGYSCAKGTEKDSRLYFDTCVYYKKHHTLHRQNGADVKKFTMSSSNRNYKVGQKYKFTLSIDEDIVFYLSHWPSRLRDVDLQISSIAERLRVDVETESETINNIVLVGDYNVEPYDKRIVHHLQTSREKELVLKRPNIFYNPCWKFLTATQTLHKFDKTGTYHFPSGQFHSWNTIDQIMFSKVFLTESWKFDDELIQIVDPNTFMEDKEVDYNLSDHYPLIANISRT